MEKTYHLLVHDTLTNKDGEPLTTIAFGANAAHLLTRGWSLVDLDSPIIDEGEPVADSEEELDNG